MSTTKLNRPVRGSGSGGMNLNPSWQDEPFEDPMEVLRKEYQRRQQMLQEEREKEQKHQK